LFNGRTWWQEVLSELPLDKWIIPIASRNIEKCLQFTPGSPFPYHFLAAIFLPEEIDEERGKKI